MEVVVLQSPSLICIIETIHTCHARLNFSFAEWSSGPEEPVLSRAPILRLAGDVCLLYRCSLSDLSYLLNPPSPRGCRLWSFFELCSSHKCPTTATMESCGPGIVSEPLAIPQSLPNLLGRLRRLQGPSLGTGVRFLLQTTRSSESTGMMMPNTLQTS